MFRMISDPFGTAHALIDVTLLLIAIPGLIVTYRLRRRIRKAIGRNLSEGEITSIKTWIEVEKAEERQRGFTSSSTERKGP